MKRTDRKNRKSGDITLVAPRDGRLLEMLRELLNDRMPSGKIKSYLEHRAVTVGGEVRTAYDHPVRRGEIIKILTGERTAPLPFKILYEDGQLLAIDKPEGLLSASTDSEKEITAFRILRESGREVYTLHRLDRDTSGVLVFAKSRETRDIMQEDWNVKVIKRGYTAICEGIFEKKSGVIETSLAESSTHMVYSAKCGGKRAVTHYTVVGESGGYSLLDINILTGRKNQIRVHMKESGHPVAGDKKYGAESDPLRRLALHATELVFIHPVSGNTVSICSDAPFSLRSLKKK